MHFPLFVAHSARLAPPVLEVAVSAPHHAPTAVSEHSLVFDIVLTGSNTREFRQKPTISVFHARSTARSSTQRRSDGMRTANREHRSCPVQVETQIRNTSATNTQVEPELSRTNPTLDSAVDGQGAATATGHHERRHRRLRERIPGARAGGGGEDCAGVTRELDERRTLISAAERAAEADVMWCSSWNWRADHLPARSAPSCRRSCAPGARK